MKTILCFGDSNTWGYNPAGGPRYSMEERWGSILRKELGEGYYVIEEGHCGRTTVFDDPIEGERNGRKYLEPCIESHSPINLVIILLGTNDLKSRFSATAQDIANGAGSLVKLIQRSNCGPDWKAPKVLLMAPPPIYEVGNFAGVFIGGAEKSKKLSYHYKNVAKQLQCYFLDTSEIIECSMLDGIHFEVQEHKKLGIAAAQMVREIL
jgi:lysophospholipase L1-like esterase